MRWVAGQLFSQLPTYPVFFFYISSHSVQSDSMWLHGLYSPWNSPGWNTGEGNLSLFRGIFPTQGLNQGLPHCSGLFTSWATREALACWFGLVLSPSSRLGKVLAHPPQWGPDMVGGAAVCSLGSLGGFLRLHPFHLWAILLFTLEPYNFPSLPSLPTHDSYLI